MGVSCYTPLCVNNEQIQSMHSSAKPFHISIATPFPSSRGTKGACTAAGCCTSGTVQLRDSTILQYKTGSWAKTRKQELM